MPAASIIVVFALATVAAFTQSLSGFGFSLLLVPPLSLAIGPRDAVVVASLLSSVVNVPAVLLWRQRIRWGLWRALISGSLLGMPVGVVVLLGVRAAVLKLIIAGVVLLATALIWTGALRIRPQRPVLDVLAGFVSGVLNTSTGISGPPVVLYLQSASIPPEPFRATLAAFFLVTSIVAVGLFAAGGAVHPDTVAFASGGLPGLLAGWWLGARAFARIGPNHFRRLVLCILLLSGVVAGATAIAG